MKKIRPAQHSRKVLGIGLGVGLSIAVVVACWAMVFTVQGTAPTPRGSSPIGAVSLDPTGSDPASADPSDTFRWDLSRPAETPLYGWTPSPSPVPGSVRGPFQMDIYKDGIFVSQMDKHACTAGATQNMLNLIGPKVDTSVAFQKEISSMLIGYTSSTDSLNGGYGPQGWATTMTKLGGYKYKLLIEPSLDKAMVDGAVALRKTNHPVGLLAWRGAHSWVMTGFRSDADPAFFPTSFKVSGAYIVDPFYPRLSEIWGQTLGPDTFRDMKAMAYNYRPWKRPEGKYPGRDGKWLLVVPVE